VGKLAKLRSKLKSSSAKTQSSFKESNVNRDSDGQFAPKNSSKLDAVKKSSKRNAEDSKDTTQRLTSQNRTVNHDRASVLGQTESWAKQYEKIDEAVKLPELKDSTKALSNGIKVAQERSQKVVDVGNSIVPTAILVENEKYHAQNLKINARQEGNNITYRSNYTGRKLGHIQQDGEFYAVHNKVVPTLKPNLFKTMNAADAFLRSTAQTYVERNVFPVDKAIVIEKYGQEQIKQLSKNVRTSGYNKAKSESLTDNQYIGEVIREDGKRKNARLIGIQDKSGNLQVAAKYSKQSDHIHIDYLATAPWNFSENDARQVKGAGAAAIAELVRLSVDSGKKGKIKLTALDGAVPFYTHLGFKKVPSGISEYALSSKDALKLLEKYG